MKDFFINKFINDNWRKIYTSEELEAGKKILLVDEEIVFSIGIKYL